MTLTFIITIDSVEDISLLNVLTHALNLQTKKNFDVVFHNQTLLSEEEMLTGLSVQPKFDYRLFAIDNSAFLGKYPVWDLYDVSQFLIGRGSVE